MCGNEHGEAAAAERRQRQAWISGSCARPFWVWQEHDGRDGEAAGAEPQQPGYGGSRGEGVESGAAFGGQCTAQREMGWKRPGRAMQCYGR